MIDVSSIRKNTSEHEEYAINWFNAHGFTGRVIHQWVTETAFEVEKDGVTDSFRLTATMQDKRKCNIKEYMEQFAKSFDMKCQIEKMKKELAEKINEDNKWKTKK